MQTIRNQVLIEASKLSEEMHDKMRQTFIRFAMSSNEYKHNTLNCKCKICDLKRRSINLRRTMDRYPSLTTEMKDIYLSTIQELKNLQTQSAFSLTQEHLTANLSDEAL